jgi:2-polyprenyl-3-methyl-5-hydroxy-6-metoxy-1,4-benzoquinol methylase
MDEKQYWKKRGVKFSDELNSQPKQVIRYMKNQEEEIIKFLNKSNWNNILELGCGTGRLTKLIAKLPNWKRFVAIDLSENLLEIAKMQTKNFPIQYQCKSIDDFSSIEKFDLVFSCEVIQHINPSNILSSLKKIISLSNNKVILVETYDYTKIGTSKDEYFFIHNYEEIFKKLNIKQIKLYQIPLPVSLKLYNKYIKFRKRTPFANQVIFELTL